MNPPFKAAIDSPAFPIIAILIWGFVIWLYTASGEWARIAEDLRAARDWIRRRLKGKP